MMKLDSVCKILMGAKYQKETIDAILESIRTQGGDRDACIAGDVSRTIYYRWRQQRPEFNQAVLEAQEHFRKNCDEDLKIYAKRGLMEYLRDGAIEEWSMQEEIYDNEQNLISIKKTHRKTRRGPPQWAIQRVLGSSMEEMEAAKILVEAGWFEASVVETLAEALESLNHKARKVLKGSTEDCVNVDEFVPQGEPEGEISA